MLARLATLLFLGSLALGSTALAACSADNCLRAVRGTANPSRPLVATSDCSSFFLATVTPATATIYVTATQVSATTTTSTETDVTTTQVLTVSTETNVVISVISSEIFTLTGLARREVVARQATVIPSLIPTYASACSGRVRYSSACSCIGVTGATATVVAPSTTIYMTQSEVTTSVTPTTEVDVVTSTVSSATTITTTITTTTVSALTISTINCAATATHQAVINPSFETGELSPWTFVKTGDNAELPDIVIEKFAVVDGQYAAFVERDPAADVNNFTLSQVLTVCPGRAYTFSFHAEIDYPIECAFYSSINGQSLFHEVFPFYAPFMQYFPGTTGGATTVTVAIMDVLCASGLHLDELTFTSS